jgi:LuxR family maltose regulon positive regulatory protein
VQRAESDGSNARVLVAAQTCRLGILIGKGEFFGALEIQAEVEPDSVARAVFAEFSATQALALACSGEQSAAIEKAQAAQSLSTTSEPQVISKLALAIASLRGGTDTAKYDYVGKALNAARTADHIDALVTAYRGCPALLDRAAASDAFGSDLAAIMVRAKDIDLASRALPTIQMPRAARSHSLTKREVEVIRLVSQGLRNKEIGERFFISEVTVKAHMRSIMRKLGARSRTHAVALFSDLAD